MVDDLRAGRTQARKKASAAMSARTAQTDAGGNDADAWMDGAYRARSMPGQIVAEDRSTGKRGASGFRRQIDPARFSL